MANCKLFYTIYVEVTDYGRFSFWVMLILVVVLVVSDFFYFASLFLLGVDYAVYVVMLYTWREFVYFFNNNLVIFFALLVYTLIIATYEILTLQK